MICNGLGAGGILPPMLRLHGLERSPTLIVDLDDAEGGNFGSGMDHGANLCH
jgi:hypothetical protein